MTIVDEAHFEAGPEGITFRSMDPSHIALIDISWPNSAFEKYEYPSIIRFGLKISEFGKNIKRSNGISTYNMDYISKIEFAWSQF